MFPFRSGYVLISNPVIIIIIIIIIIIYDYTSNNWSHWNSNEKPKEKSGSCTRKTFDRFTTKDSCTWNIKLIIIIIIIIIITIIT